MSFVGAGIRRLFNNLQQIPSTIKNTCQSLTPGKVDLTRRQWILTGLGASAVAVTGGSYLAGYNPLGYLWDTIDDLEDIPEEPILVRECKKNGQITKIPKAIEFVAVDGKPLKLEQPVCLYNPPPKSIQMLPIVTGVVWNKKDPKRFIKFEVTGRKKTKVEYIHSDNVLKILCGDRAVWSLRWPNFSPEEIAQQPHKPYGTAANLQNFSIKMRALPLDGLQAMRKFLDAPITISSAYRSEARNIACGGKPQSEHLHGGAFDIYCADDKAMKQLVVAAYKAGFTGFGLGKTKNGKLMLHIDMGERRTWSYRGFNNWAILNAVGIFATIPTK